MRADGMGEATAGTLRWVSTVTSEMPSAVSAVTAPRAVAPKLITAARKRGPYNPVVPQLQGMQHRAVAREFVVHVEDVHVKVAVGLPVFIASQAIRVSRRSMPSWVTA